MGCTSLTAVDLPPYLEKLSDGMFQKCVNLERISLPEGIAEIGPFAFSGCSKLKEIVIPESVADIGQFAFSGCSSLEEVRWKGDGTKQAHYIRANAFRNCRSLTTLEIPEGTVTIEQGAFEDCSLLNEIILPESLKRIDRFAFEGCASIGGLVLPRALQATGSEAFAGCRSLSELTIPESVADLGNGVFRQCDGLKRLTLFGRTVNVSGCEITSVLHRNLRKMLETGSFNDNKTGDAVYLFAVQEYIRSSGERKGRICRFMRKRKEKIIGIFIRQGDVETVKQLFERTGFVTAESVDTYLRMAADLSVKDGRAEMLAYMTDYRYRHYGGDDPYGNLEV